MAATLSQLRARLDKLNAAIHSGAMSVSYSTPDGGSTSVTYTTLDNMLRARADLERQIAGNPTRPRQGVVRFSRGL